jgi:hypothetical protein
MFRTIVKQKLDWKENIFQLFIFLRDSTWDSLNIRMIKEHCIFDLKYPMIEINLKRWLQLTLYQLNLA